MLLIKHYNREVLFFYHCMKPAAPLKHIYVQRYHRPSSRRTAQPTAALSPSAWPGTAQPARNNLHLRCSQEKLLSDLYTDI